MTTATTMTRRLKPARTFSPLGRAIHEIQLFNDGSAVYLVQPVEGAPSGAMNSVIRFGFADDAGVYDRAVESGELIEMPVIR